MSEAWAQWEGHVVNGEFHLQKYLGGSSESAVFLTEHRSAELSPAAIKLIPANEATRDRYLSRWSAAEKLAHPHLIRLLQKGCCRLGELDLVFVVMEYAEENLAEVITERPLTPPEVRDLLKPALDALGYLHGRGFVHGRLKPANVLAAKDRLKLSSDWLFIPGDATAPPERASVFDPPEKASGKISPAGDVWSLGMTLVAALTQHPPSWSDKELTDPEVPADLSAPFFDLVRGCLRRDPEQRLTIAGIGERLEGQRSATQLPAPQTAPQPQSPTPRPVSQAPNKPSDIHPAHAQPAQSQPIGESTLGSPQSLVGPLLIGVLAVTALLAGLGLLRRPPDASDGKTAGQHQPTQPATSSSSNGYGAVAGSRQKPSPVQGRRQAAAASVNLSSPDSVAVPSQPVPGNDVVLKVFPQVPQRARGSIQGTIRVGIKVQVDSFGNVVGSEVNSPGPSKYFARLAAEAAQGWKFSPSNRDAGRDFILQFDFTNTETTASATLVISN
jgi:TonB family protein